jgi:hypothetical protein
VRRVRITLLPTGNLLLLLMIAQSIDIQTSSRCYPDTPKRLSSVMVRHLISLFHLFSAATRSDHHPVPVARFGPSLPSAWGVRQVGNA